jgi:hypothetical protein
LGDLKRGCGLGLGEELALLEGETGTGQGGAGEERDEVVFGGGGHVYKLRMETVKNAKIPGVVTLGGG